MTCPHCQAAIADGARFCPACGKAISATESQSGMPAMTEGPNMLGREIGGRYRILAKLGEGGMGAVYRGEQISLKRACAIKLLRPELSANPMILRRFNAEAEVVAKLGHPNTVNIYDFGQDRDGSLFIAMELIEGASLRKVIHEQGPLPPQRALAIAMQVAASLADAHAHGIIHRDLKPDNVMMQTRGRQRDVVRVLDFGIAKLRDDSRATQQAMTQAGDMLGTPQYMAPEQIRGDAIDGRTDVYALGCMLYEMLTARMPFEAPTVMAMLSKHLLEMPVAPSVRRPDLGLPPAIDQLVMTAMAKHPDGRPSTMDQFAEHLAHVQATLPHDPPRAASAQVSAPHGVMSPPPVTPAAFSAHAHATPAAMAPMTPAAFSAYGPATPAPMAPTPMAPPPPHSEITPAKHHTALFTVLGLLVVCGGIGAFVATRESSTHTRDAGVSLEDHGSEVEREPDPPALPDAAAVKSDDPWAPGAEAPPSRVVQRQLGTAETPMPDGARLEVPDGFVEVADPSGKGSLIYNNPAANALIVLGPLVGGTNDIAKLSAIWTNTTAIGFKVTGQTKIYSAGAARDAVGFDGNIGGVPTRQLIVAYITPRYRLGLLIQATTTMFADATFQQNVQAFLASGVILP